MRINHRKSYTVNMGIFHRIIYMGTSTTYLSIVFCIPILIQDFSQYPKKPSNSIATFLFWASNMNQNA